LRDALRGLLAAAVDRLAAGAELAPFADAGFAADAFFGELFAVGVFALAVFAPVALLALADGDFVLPPVAVEVAFVRRDLELLLPLPGISFFPASTTFPAASTTFPAASATVDATFPAPLPTRRPMRPTTLPASIPSPSI
jgi:hypothetical protein